MQTSFMHPPFGFALFYLRGISDTLFKNGALPKKVLSSDIYMGAIPWVVMQLVLVAIVIFVPQTVTMFLDEEVKGRPGQGADRGPGRVQDTAPSNDNVDDIFKDAAPAAEEPAASAP